MISEFAKEKVFWTRKMNLKLVKFIENRPNIWNPRHPNYTSAEHRDQTYAEFASKYGNEFTGQAVRDRWTNIRSTFANYLRKMKASVAKGDGEVYKVNWHLWDACAFLLKVNRKNKSSNSSHLLEETKYNTVYESEEISTDKDNVSNGSLNEADTSCQNIANGILNVFRGVQNDVFDVDNTEYGRLTQTICSRLSEMSSFEASRVSSKIMDVLWLYHEDNQLNPNNVKTEGML